MIECDVFSQMDDAIYVYMYIVRMNMFLCVTVHSVYLQLQCGHPGKNMINHWSCLYYHYAASTCFGGHRPPTQMDNIAVRASTVNTKTTNQWNLIWPFLQRIKLVVVVYTFYCYCYLSFVFWGFKEMQQIFFLIGRFCFIKVLLMLMLILLLLNQP